MFLCSISNLGSIWRYKIFIPLLIILGLALSPNRAMAIDHYLERIVYSTPEISNMWITGISYMPQTMRIEWDAKAGGTGNAVCSIIRKNGTFAIGLLTPASGTNHFSVEDTTGFANNTLYQYEITAYGQDDPPTGYPSSCDDTSHNHIYVNRTVWNSASVTIDVKPFILFATENQAVDSRLDLRYADNHYLDFQFGDRKYKGGLFAGYANDPSRVGRSFIKFPFSYTLPPDTYLWTASVNAYYLASFANGTTTVGCQKTATTWNKDTIVWTNAPSVNPGQAVNGIALTYDSENPNPCWCCWPIGANEVTESLKAGATAFSASLSSTNETANGWAYFAKKEYDSTKTPVLIYATQAPIAVVNLTVSPTSVRGGNSATGTVSINNPAPTGGYTVWLSLKSTTAATPYPFSFPASVTIPAGSYSTTFTITTTQPPGMMPVSLTISAGSSSYYKVATLSITSF